MAEHLGMRLGRAGALDQAGLGRSRARLRLALISLFALAVLAGGATQAWRAVSSAPLDLSAAQAHSKIVLDRDGRLLRAFATSDGRWRLPITAGEVDARYLDLLLAYEDKRFRQHGGIDPTALGRAIGQFVREGRIVSGASTLTMQVARLLDRGGSERSLGAKVSQAARAVRLERRFSKDEILGLYLSLAPFGGNLEGVRAASLAYLGKEPRRLSLGEAALLVALPQSPETRRPDRFVDIARRARDRVLDRALRAGLIDAKEALAARAEPVAGERRPFPALAAHAAEAALAEQPDRGTHNLTIEGRLQASLEALARERAASLGPKLSLAIIVVDHATGAVRASVGGPQHLAPERAGALDMTRALRSPGSALKPFVYALAFESGLAHPETILEDRPGRWGLYQPENFDLSFQGTVTARRALQLSLNVPAIDLLSHLGPRRFLAALRRAGADVVLPPGGEPGLAVGLGGLGISLHDLAQLYTALARGGEAVRLTMRTDRESEPAQAHPLVDPVAAWHVGDILRGAPAPPNASGGKLAFKTGTSYGYRDAWAAGFDRRHTVAVWVGRPDNAAVPGLVGRLVAAPILFDAFARLGIEPDPAPAPRGTIHSSNTDLPPPLRHLRHDVPKTAASMSKPRLRIAFPPDGARLEWASAEAEAGDPVVLKALGGAGPFTWLVDGRPVAGPHSRRFADWRPDGRGFARVSVLDAEGASDSVLVRVQ